MTTKELATMIDKETSYHVRGSSGGFLAVDVRVMDAKMSYGRVILQITPTLGTGAIWVNGDTINMDLLQEAV